MKTKHYILIALFLLFATAALTNPDTDKHKEEVKTKMNAFYDDKLAENDNEANDQWSQAGRSLGVMLGKSMIDKMIDNVITSSNFIVFSTTKVNWEGNTKTIGIGLFGNVFLSKEINEVLQQNN